MLAKLSILGVAALDLFMIVSLASLGPSPTATAQPVAFDPPVPCKCHPSPSVTVDSGPCTASVGDYTKVNAACSDAPTCGDQGNRCAVSVPVDCYGTGCSAHFVLVARALCEGHNSDSKPCPGGPDVTLLVFCSACSTTFPP